MTLGEKIAENRRARGMTQEEVANLLGVTSQAVSKWENNNSLPDITLLPAIADLFETTIDALMSRERSDVVRFVPEKTRKSIDEMFLHIQVISDDTKINVNLPLAIVKAFADAMGMAVEAANRDGAAGAVFTLIFASPLVVRDLNPEGLS